MATNWRISSFSGTLLAAYFIPIWVMVAFRIIEAPVRGLFERPDVAAAFFLEDHLQWGATGLVRAAWLLALGRLTVVAFFVVFLLLLCRPKIRVSGGCDEALGLALGIGSVISFALMLMASKVGELDALRLHVTELLMFLGTIIVLAVEGPAPAAAASSVPAEPLPLEQPQLLNNG
jgi:hypothetical protein